MANLRQLSSKDVRNGIKHGLTTADFCAKYECTEEQFMERLQVFYRRGVNDVLRELEANAKKHNAPPKGKTIQHPSDLPQRVNLDQSALAVFSADPAADRQEVCAQPTGESVCTQPTEESQYAPPPENESSQRSKDSDLSQLLQLESSMSKEIMALESQHKATARKHRECIRKLRCLSEEMQEIEAQFRSKAAEYEAIVNENNGLVAEMNALSQRRAEGVATLTDLRQKIETLQVLPVCVYRDGRVEALDQEDVNLMDDGYENIFIDLRERDECEELRIKDIKLLARVLTIVRNTERRLEVIFEDEALDPLFRQFSCNMTRQAS